MVEIIYTYQVLNLFLLHEESKTLVVALCKVVREGRQRGNILIRNRSETLADNNNNNARPHGDTLIASNTSLLTPPYPRDYLRPVHTERMH